MRLTKQDIEKLKALYEKCESDEGSVTYDDLTPNLQNYADFVADNMPVVRALARTEFKGWGGNGYAMAMDSIENHAPKLSKHKDMDESEFTSLIFEKMESEEWEWE